MLFLLEKVFCKKIWIPFSENIVNLLVKIGTFLKVADSLNNWKLYNEV